MGAAPQHRDAAAGDVSQAIDCREFIVAMQLIGAGISGLSIALGQQPRRSYGLEKSPAHWNHGAILELEP